MERCDGFRDAVPKASAQTVSIQADLLKDWTELKATMAKIAEAMPEDKSTFKATPAERSYGSRSCTSRR